MVYGSQRGIGLSIISGENGTVGILAEHRVLNICRVLGTVDGVVSRAQNALISPEHRAHGSMPQLVYSPESLQSIGSWISAEPIPFKSIVVHGYQSLQRMGS